MKRKKEGFFSRQMIIEFPGQEILREDLQALTVSPVDDITIMRGASRVELHPAEVIRKGDQKYLLSRVEPGKSMTGGWHSFEAEVQVVE